MDSGAEAAALVAGGVFYMFFLLIMLAFSVFMIVCRWKIFEKAGQPGWACLVPIYNIMVMFDIAGKPMWQMILLFIPFANIYVAFTLVMDIAKRFGKDSGFGLGMIFVPVIFYPMLAFGDAQYTAPEVTED